MNNIREFLRENWPFMAVVALMAVMLMCGGCSRKTLPITHDTVRIVNTEYRNLHHYDSVYIHDSMWVEVKGDTIWVDRWHTRYAERTNIDSIYLTDTMYQVREVPVEIEVTKTRVPAWAWVLLAINVIACAYLYIIIRRKT